MDLFVGIRLKPFLYGVSVNGYLLENNGKGFFKNITKEIAPQLLDVGLITCAAWDDMDSDGDSDLIIAGEWMPIKIFKNDKGKFTDITEQAGLTNTNGWWNTIERGDFDKDGDMDFVIGNHGLNSRFKASMEKPVTMYVNDFDKNGTAEQIICAYFGEKSFPLALKHDIEMQMPGLKKKYLKYENYKGQTMEDIFLPEQLEKALIIEVYNLETSLLINNGNGTFKCVGLPKEAQLSPTYGLLVDDFDKDGNLDILMGGNLFEAKPEVGRYDASYGNFLKGDGQNNFSSVANNSGFLLSGQTRDILKIKAGSKQLVFVAKNNDKMQLFEYKD